MRGAPALMSRGLGAPSAEEAFLIHGQAMPPKPLEGGTLA
jgi:hypothetical protein